MAQSAVVTETINLKVANSGPMSAYVARPEGDGPHPGLMVFQ
jgi:dienelactone hydrolase